MSGIPANIYRARFKNTETVWPKSASTNLKSHISNISSFFLGGGNFSHITISHSTARPRIDVKIRQNDPLLDVRIAYLLSFHSDQCRTLIVGHRQTVEIEAKMK